MGYRVVHDLTRNLTEKNHHVFYDNFVSIVKLAEDLLKDQIYSCPTARANREDFPKDLAANNPCVKRLKQGEALFRQENNAVATTWKDKKVVHLISIESNSSADCSHCEELQQEHGRHRPSRSVAWVLHYWN